jgi:hypothetical protein
MILLRQQRRQRAQEKEKGVLLESLLPGGCPAIGRVVIFSPVATLAF